MELVASAASARQILANFERLGLEHRTLDVGYVDPALQRSSGPLKVSARLSFDLLEAAATRLDQPDFGLRHALWLNLRGLDSISLLWDQAGSIAEWYDLARKYVHLENNALSYNLTEEGDEVALVHEMLSFLRPTSVQASFAFLAMTARVFREILGPHWTPQRVEYMASAPADKSLFRSFFRCRLEFDAPRDALVVTREDFERPLTRYNPNLVKFLEAQLHAQSQSQAQEIDDIVFAILVSELAGTPPRLDQIASRLALTPRTLQRRLSTKQTSYGALLTRARTEIAMGHLRRVPRTSLARLAYELGFSDATAACRFLRKTIDIKQA